MLAKNLILSLSVILLINICWSTTEVTQYVHQSLTLLPRQKAPFWSGITVEGEKFVKKNSEEYKGKYLVLLFYPFDFTYVCPTELISFSENMNKFREIGAEVVGISTDSHFTHLAWIRTPRSQGGVGKLNFPLLADISKKVSRSFRVLVEDETDDLFGASLRGLFIIDDKGIIRSFTINDAAVGRSVDETLRLVQAFQHSDKYGDVCPANWKPGSATIIPDQEKKGEYFKNEFKGKEDF
jgi:alkyl hydroperoxide reductase subunit AhpC